MMTGEDRERRKAHWTATDSARAIINAYGGLAAVVAGKLYGVETESNEAIEIGQALERPLLRWAIEQVDTEAEYTSRYQVWCDRIVPDDVPLGATLDCLLDSGPATPENKIIIEAKTAGFSSDYSDVSQWGEPDTDQVPPYVMIQVQHQMLVTWQKFVYVAAWIRGRGKLLYKIEADHELQAHIMTYARLAWRNFVVKGIIPEAGMDDAQVVLAALSKVQRVPMKQIVATDSITNAIELYEKLSAARLATEKVEAQMKAVIIQRIGDATEALLPDGRIARVTTVNVKGGTYTRNPSQHVRLAVVETGKQDKENKRVGSTKTTRAALPAVGD